MIGKLPVFREICNNGTFYSNNPYVNDQQHRFQKLVIRTWAAILGEGGGRHGNRNVSPSSIHCRLPK